MYNILLDKIISWGINSFKKIDTKSTIIFIMGIIILVLLLLKGCGNSNSDITVNGYKQNIAALNDTIRSYKTKNGELVYEKYALISKVGELGKYSNDLEEEIKKLKDNPIVVVKYKTVVEHIPFGVPVYPDFENATWSPDSSYALLPFKWSYDTTYSNGNARTLSGEFIVKIENTMGASVKDFMVTEDKLNISFTTGLTENKDGLIEIFITSDYPGFRPTSIEGALIDPRDSKVIKKYFPPKRWGLGIYGGYGVHLNPTNGDFGHGLQLGLGVSYNILQWNGKK
jgi:hypothetical protein